MRREGIFYHFHNMMYTPFLSVDETNNDRGRGFFYPRSSLEKQ